MPDDGQGALDLYINTATGAACDSQPCQREGRISLLPPYEGDR